MNPFAVVSAGQETSSFHRVLPEGSDALPDLGYIAYTAGPWVEEDSCHVGQVFSVAEMVMDSASGRVAESFVADKIWQGCRRSFGIAGFGSIAEVEGLAGPGNMNDSQRWD